MNRQIQDDALYNDRFEEEEKLKSDIDIKITDNDWLGFIGCSLGFALWFLFLGIILILLIKIRMLIWNAL